MDIYSKSAKKFIRDTKRDYAVRGLVVESADEHLINMIAYNIQDIERLDSDIYETGTTFLDRFEQVKENPLIAEKTKKENLYFVQIKYLNEKLDIKEDKK